MQKILFSVVAGIWLLNTIPLADATEFRYTPAKIGLTDTASPTEGGVDGEDEDEDDQANLEDQADALIEHGMDYLGVRYRRGGNSPATGLDCSGLVQNVFRNSLGLQLPRRAADMAKLGDKIDRKNLMPGDLVFFKTSRPRFSHVGIYVGDGKFLHAPSSGGVVRIESIAKTYWRSRFTGGRRLLANS